MNNDELKKKIIVVLGDSVDKWFFVQSTTIGNNYGELRPKQKFCINFDKLADALIAAGIGDVKTVQKIATSATDMAVLEAAQAEHRALVAEKALQKFAETITCEDCPFFSDCASSEKMEDLIHSNYCFAEYLKQAEKELAEENSGKKKI